MLVMYKVDNCWDLSKFEGYQSLSIELEPGIGTYTWGPRDMRIVYYDY